MKIITGVCAALLVSGMALGWWLFGDFSGSAVGLFLTGCVAVPLYWLSNTSARNAAVRADKPVP